MLALCSWNTSWTKYEKWEMTIGLWGRKLLVYQCDVNCLHSLIVESLQRAKRENEQGYTSTQPHVDNIIQAHKDCNMVLLSQAIWHFVRLTWGFCKLWQTLTSCRNVLNVFSFIRDTKIIHYLINQENMQNNPYCFSASHSTFRISQDEKKSGNSRHRKIQGRGQRVVEAPSMSQAPLQTMMTTYQMAKFESETPTLFTWNYKNQFLWC